jgi:hypothetical protein
MARAHHQTPRGVQSRLTMCASAVSAMCVAPRGPHEAVCATDDGSHSRQQISAKGMHHHAAHVGLLSAEAVASFCRRHRCGALLLCEAVSGCGAVEKKRAFYSRDCDYDPVGMHFECDSCCAEGSDCGCDCDCDCDCLTCTTSTTSCFCSDGLVRERGPRRDEEGCQPRTGGDPSAVVCHQNGVPAQVVVPWRGVRAGPRPSSLAPHPCRRRRAVVVPAVGALGSSARRASEAQTCAPQTHGGAIRGRDAQQVTHQQRSER